jgi:hypothetical protein
VYGYGGNDGLPTSGCGLKGQMAINQEVKATRCTSITKPHMAPPPVNPYASSLNITAA